MILIKYPIRNSWKQLMQRPVSQLVDIEMVVAPIFENVKIKGDKALKEYTLKFDKVNIDSLKVTDEEINEAVHQVSQELKSAINIAKNNIEKFHSAQQTSINKIETMPGVVCWRKNVAIQKVGFYIPGGTAPLFSTILMLAVPAHIASCTDVLLCTPPNIEGKIHPAILYTASICGVKNIYKVGGAQAIAAMAFGTESVMKVDKIFGPGNQFVTVAKQLANKAGTAIDMPAGPSELAIISDRSSNPVFLAADLLSQAEHGADSQVIMVSTDENILNLTQIEVNKQLLELPRIELAKISLSNSKFILLQSDEEITDFINDYAPEHLIIATDQPEMFADKILNAGSIFLGHFTPEAAGDYASGTNHTLPTNGHASAYSGVSLDSFYKKITFQTINKMGLLNIGKTVQIMAEAEMLDAHKNAITVRLNYIEKNNLENRVI